MFTTQPYEMYQRLFSETIEGAPVIGMTHLDLAGNDVFDTISVFSNDGNYADESIIAIYVFNDVLVFVDNETRLFAPAEFFDVGNLPPFEELFGMIAVYNRYITDILFPLAGACLLVLIVLQAFFYLVSAVFLKVFRLASDPFSFAERFKIVVMSSLPLALICCVLGFYLPAFHIILFQMINQMLLFYFSRRYDKKEKELAELKEKERIQGTGIGTRYPWNEV